MTARRSAIQNTEITEQPKIVVVLESTEKRFDYEPFGLDFDSENEEIVRAINSALQESDPQGIDLYQEFRDGNWTVKKQNDSRMTYIFPKSTAGAVGVDMIIGKEYYIFPVH